MSNVAKIPWGRGSEIALLEQLRPRRCLWDPKDPNYLKQKLKLYISTTQSNYSSIHNELEVKRPLFEIKIPQCCCYYCTCSTRSGVPKIKLIRNIHTFVFLGVTKIRRKFHHMRNLFQWLKISNTKISWCDPAIRLYIFLNIRPLRTSLIQRVYTLSIFSASKASSRVK